jgi:hypothetical protein
MDRVVTANLPALNAPDGDRERLLRLTAVFPKERTDDLQWRPGCRRCDDIASQPTLNTRESSSKDTTSATREVN